MNSKKTILIVANHTDSVLKFRTELIERLHIDGHRVVVACPDLNDTAAQHLAKVGAEVYRFEMKRTGMDPIADLLTFLELRRLCLTVSPDVLITYTIKPTIWGTLAAKCAGIGHVVAIITGLGFTFTNGRGVRREVGRRVATFLYRYALRFASVIMFLNPDDMLVFKEGGLLPPEVGVHVINGEGVNINHYSKAPLSGEPAFIMIARLLGDKGVREFGEAAEMLKARYPSVSIQLVGYLDESPDCVTAAELNSILAAGVELVGRLEDVRPAIADSSVFVLPSYREGTPRSTLEAMSMGRAVVTTDAPGCRETVVHGVNGYLVPPRDAVALAAAMEKFILDPSLAGRMGVESRRIVEERYDVNLVNAEIMRHAGLLDPVN